MLSELSKNDKLWRKYAIKITGCRSKADDLVQDMYIKLCNYDKTITCTTVYKILKRLHIDNIRTSKPKCDIQNHINTLLDDSIEKLENRKHTLELIKNTTFFEREVLLLTHETSLRKAEKEIDVPWYVLDYHKKKTLKKLRQEHGRRNS